MTTTAGRMGSLGLMDAHRISPGTDADFYPSAPWSFRWVAEVIMALDPEARSAWEAACGAGHGVHGLRDVFPKVFHSDLLSYDGNPLFDFAAPIVAGETCPVRADWIVTNHPFNLTQAFIQNGLARARRGLALLMKVNGLETQGRHPWLYGDQPLGVFAPFVERMPLLKGRWDPDANSAAFYAWFLWFKPGVGPALPVVMGRRRPIIIDIPPGTAKRLSRADDAALFGVRG